MLLRPHRRHFRRVSAFLSNQPYFVRNIYAENLLEDFFVSAVAGVLAIRLYLAATGFPQLSFGTLHIAHLTWGGLFMLVAMVMLLAFFNRRAHSIAAVIGGVGFGAFIDEVGKFITRDNDYFFRPTVAVIYVVFVLVFFAIRAISRTRPPSPQEALANAFHATMQAGLSGIDRDQQSQALELLEKVRPGLARENLAAILRNMDVTPVPRFRPVRHLHELLDSLYERAAPNWWFSGTVISFFAITAVTSLSAVLGMVEWSLGLALWLVAGLIILAALAWSKRDRALHLDIVVAAVIVIVTIAITWAVLANLKAMPLSIVDIAQFVFPGISGVIIVLGVTVLPRSRLHAYLLFRVAVLVTIFLTQVLSFYEQQFFALVGLGLNILILLALRYMIAHEHRKIGIPETAGG